MFTRPTALGCLALLCLYSSAVSAAPDPNDTADRYLDVQRCMERTIGKQWQEKYGIEVVRNQWGAVEVSADSIDTAPQIIRVTDLRCRRLSNLAGQPRP